jgi:hypothetical protein
MRNLLSLLGFALVVFLAVGWYLDWYSFSSKPSDNGHLSFEVDVNKKKIGDDVQHGVEVGKQKVGEVIEGVKDATKKK